jgi:hypothetical protein
MFPRTLAIALTTAMLAFAHLPAADAAKPRFQMPVPCGQTWDASTYAGHAPDPDSLDFIQYNANRANVSEGEPVLASAAGRVTKTETGSPNPSLRVFLDHGDGWFTHYIHLEELPPLSPGDYVAQGEQIGRTSNSGTATVHLHYSQADSDRAKAGEAYRAEFDGVPVATHEGDPSTWDRAGLPTAERITSANCAGNTFLHWNQGNQHYYLLYKPSNGEVKIVRLAADGKGVTTTWTGQWTRGWTHLAAFDKPGTDEPHAILYKSSTGQASFVRLKNGGAGVTVLRTHTWKGGWTSIVPIRRGADFYFLAYDSLHGNATFHRINSAGNGSAHMWSEAWESGRTSVLSYETNLGEFLLLYKGGTGEVEINEITGTGSSIGIREVWRGTWTTGWTDLVPVYHSGIQYLVGHKAPTGEVAVMRTASSGQGVTVVARSVWTLGWTAFSGLTIDRKGTLLIYKLTTGEVKTMQLRYSGGLGFVTLWRSFWQRGWT